jgi:hypothetical protein
MLDVPQELTQAQVAAAKSKADLNDSTSVVEAASAAELAKTTKRDGFVAGSVSDRTASNSAGVTVQGPSVPDLRGKTLREVLEQTAAGGLVVDVEGEGVARQQEPAPGSALAQGVRIKVLFSR